MKKLLKFEPGYGCLLIVLSFIMQLLLNKQSAKKKSCKRDMVEVFCTKGLIIVLTLLIKTIAILVRVALIKFCKISLQKFFSGLGLLSIGLT